MQVDDNCGLGSSSFGIGYGEVTDSVQMVVDATVEVEVVLEEEAVDFRCQVQGDPQPTVRWKKDDADLPRGR